MKINQLGEISDNKGLYVSPSTNKTEFLAKYLEEIKSLTSNGDNNSYSYTSTDNFSCSLYFTGEILNFVSVSISTEKGESWDNWSEQDEIKIRGLLLKWLKSYNISLTLKESPIGEIYFHKYRWGGISCQYDSRSGNSSVSIRYKQL